MKRRASSVTVVTLLLLQLLQHHDGGVAAFAPSAPSLRFQAVSATTLYLAKTKRKKKGGSGKAKKMSYAERLQQHKAQLVEEQGPAAVAHVPVDDGTEEKQLAKEMINAQRRSVDMLTFVRERVEGLPLAQIVEALVNGDGYIVVDDFLASDEVVSQLQQEGRNLFEQQLMETDLTRLGSGEFVAAVKGGEEQYAACPRTVEMVVSTTKYLAGCLSDSVQHADAFDKLDPSNCMASLRTYDRASRLASLSLLAGGELPAQPFDVAANGVEEDDARNVTVLYYPIAQEWSSIASAGGITIEQNDAEERLIPAKRDRLVLLRSDSCRHRPEYFDAGENGDDALSLASCLELHLVTKPKPVMLNN
jgi:hypothetical protein